VRFWCSTLEVPWSWKFRAYPGIWLAVAALVVPYLVAHSRRHGPNAERRRHTAFYLSGILVFWLATDWPLGLLGASYNAWAHMAQFMIYVSIAAPLILLGIPEWMGRAIVGRLRIYRLTHRLARPVTAGVTFNLLLLFTHAPWTVDTLRANQFGSFAMDVVWLTMGLVVWLPVISPLPEQRMTSYPGKMTYLFLSMGLVPSVPAGFLTFASFPLYATYELAPRVHGLAADTDQQMAGLIMKLGGIPIVWGTIAVMMMRWWDSEQSGSQSEPQAAAT